LVRARSSAAIPALRVPVADWQRPIQQLGAWVSGWEAEEAGRCARGWWPYPGNYLGGGSTTR